MAPIRVGINGFGRIGRCAFKQLVTDDRFEVVGINDLADLGDLAYLLKYDSVHGWWAHKVGHEPGRLLVDGRPIPAFSCKEPAALPWGDLGGDIVLESSGAFRSREGAAGHLAAGARKVVISAPSDDADGIFVLGVNEHTYDPARQHVLSMASCTTNCLAPIAKVLHESFGVRYLTITTVHAYTSSQALMDTPVRKRRRGRAAAVSLVPTTTGAAKATEKVLPALAGRMDGMAIRAPIPDGSITDVVALLERSTTIAEIHAVLEAAAGRPPLAGILRVSDEALVSRDIIGDPHSSIVDRESTQLLDGRLAKLLAWYDNEWGYSARLKDFAAFLGRS
jgi:glyceraldehyde 3-phosphate dehydrogenase